MKLSNAWVAGVAFLLHCTEHSPTPAPAATPAAPATSAPPAAPTRKLPPPTRDDNESAADKHYYYWEPGASVADLGKDPRARAEAVLASAEIRELLGAAAGDGFVYQRSDEKKHMVTFRQTRDVRGQPVIVADAYATVELAGDTDLVYLGTGFRRGITLADDPITVDEARAREIAEAAYEAQEKFKGKATPHRDEGLRIQEVRGKGTCLAYEIHVERAEGDGHPRPFMFVVDAQSGEVLRQYQSWIE